MNFKYYNHLGFHNPYFIQENSDIKLYENFQSAIQNFKGNKVLNISSVIEVLNKGYTYGDKTLVENLYKSPWMAKISSDQNNWDFFDLPKHQEIIKESEEVADTFFALLEEELLDYIHDYKKIGILLTGGMDSRIVACVLGNLQKNGKISDDVKVKAYTWGKENSRDVVYASRIAKSLDWDWEHLQVDKYQMLENLQATIAGGSEYSPIHLHAMLQLREKADEVECFLAGSFGDSVGRAEYSGVKVENLLPLSLKSNKFSLIKKSLVEKHRVDTLSEIEKYHNLFKQDKPYQQYEQDYQLHYMRKMLNACMSLIDEKIPLFQMFSSPKVFGYMWSLHPKVRSNEIYRIILQKYNPQLMEIPWARTGLRYPETEGTADQYSKSHHSYGQLIRKEILPEYKDVLLKNDLNIFNKYAVKLLYKLCTDMPIKNNYSYEGLLIYIISLIKTCELYSIETPYIEHKNELEFKELIKDFGRYSAKVFLK